MTDSITVVIPTYKRPDRLLGCLHSALAQAVPGRDVRVLVVDNDGGQSARPVVEALSDARVRYVCEPAPGVSNARNRAVADVLAQPAPSRHIFFLDDDMIAEPGCVARLLSVMDAHGAGVAFAAVEAVMPEDMPGAAPMQPFFSRRPGIPEGPTQKGLGAGGSLFDLQRCPLPSPVFDPACNETGGEDDLLLSHLLDAGVRFVWVPSAVTRELVPAHRATLAYLWTRNFAFGQGPTQMAADDLHHSRTRREALRARAAIARWMGIGAAQFALRLPAWLLTRASRSDAHATAHAKLAQAAGKVLWWGDFRAVLYGASAPKAASAELG